jgi:hypothetical protein
MRSTFKLNILYNNLCGSGYGPVSGCGEHCNKYLYFIERGEVLDYLKVYHILRKTLIQACSYFLT